MRFVRFLTRPPLPRRVKAAALVPALVLVGLVFPRPARAQVPRPWEGPRWWMGAWFGGLFLASVDDPDTGTWLLGDNVAGGAQVGLRLAQGAFLVADLSYTRVAYDRVDGLDGVVSGDADILITGLGVRYSFFRGPALLYSPFGILGLGAVHYRLDDLGEFDTDFSLVAGGGLDWRLNPSLKIVVAGYEFLAFHQRPGGRGRSNTSRHTELRLGLRWGL